MGASKWAQGIQMYAEELQEFLTDENLETTEENMLNGADNWTQYSLGGSSLIYNEDIAERLATKSEYESRISVKYGLNDHANKNETWLDVQARALYQASQLVLANKAKELQNA
jgi:imidazoleglycerol phosphate dehydratase HisB